MGWEKVACWSTKAAISLKREKIDEKVLWRAYRNSPTLFRTVTSRPPKIGVRNPTQNFNPCYFQERVKLYGLQSWPVHSQFSSEQKPIKNLGVKGAWACPGTAHIFWIAPIISGRVKLRTSNCVRTFVGSIGTKPIKNFGKSSRGRRDSQNLSGPPRRPMAHRAVIFL